MEWRYGVEVWSGGMEWRYGVEVWSGGMERRYGVEVWSGGMGWRYGCVKVWRCVYMCTKCRCVDVWRGCLVYMYMWMCGCVALCVLRLQKC